jgi:hypothetical protein
MSTGAIIAVAAAVVIVVAIIAAVMLQRSGGPMLKSRFGPEYDRVLARHDGATRATRRELADRVKRYRGLELRPMTAQTRERYAARWSEVQARFVDDPADAVGAADTLIAELAVERGYPAANSPEHVDALSVHHPHHVQGYREAHAAALAHGEGRRVDTEAQRKALVAARGLFDELMSRAEAGADAAPPEPPAPPPPPAVEEEPANDDGSRSALGKRFAGLTARGGKTEAHQ